MAQATGGLARGGMDSNDRLLGCTAYRVFMVLVLSTWDIVATIACMLRLSPSQGY